MSRLADLQNVIDNAIQVIGRSQLRLLVFESVNSKLTAPEIARQIKKEASNVANELRLLEDRGLIQPIRKRGKAPIYSKIPELRGINLRSLLNKKQIKHTTQNTKLSELKVPEAVKTSSGIKSRAIDNVIGIGKQYSIENIDQNWVDALVVLNFIETAATKFLMDHGFSEQKIKDDQMHWNEKLDKLEAKLYEEARLKGTRPKTSILTVIRNYRQQRNDLDHEAHVPSAKLSPHDVKMLLFILRVFVNEIFEEHKKYCMLI